MVIILSVIECLYTCHSYMLFMYNLSLQQTDEIDASNIIPIFHMRKLRPSRIFFFFLILVLVAWLCPTLCDPMDYSPPGFSSMEFSREEYWSGLAFHSPGDPPDPGTEPRSPELQADSLPNEPPGKTW